MTRAESAGRSRRPGRPIAENLSLNGHDDRPFPATLSVLSADALGRLIEVEYDLGPVEACQLFTPGVTHTYLVKTENEKYMLRVYRHAWRTPSDVQY